MRILRYILVLFSLFVLATPKASGQFALVGFDTIYITKPNGLIADTLRIGTQYTLTAQLTNYEPSTPYAGPFQMYYKGQNNNSQQINFYLTDSIFLGNNTPSNTFVVPFQLPPLFVTAQIFGGGVTTVVVWPQVAAPITNPYVIEVVIGDLVNTTEINANYYRLNIAPNPANNVIVISNPNIKTFADATVTIYDITGKKQNQVSTRLTEQGYPLVDITQLPQGLYIAECMIGVSRFTQRFVKE